MWLNFLATFKLVKKNPIGIFDSGVGGLTVASEIHKLMPFEKLIYFGDTLHLPYGDKSAAAIKNYSEKIALYLLSMGCKAIVIACNTASAVAFSTVQKIVGKKCIIINVIDPCVESTQLLNSKQIGIIGTKTTIASGVYKAKIDKKNTEAIVNQKATPLLAPMIEEGFINDTVSREVLSFYLNKDFLSNLETLILGCTHYPILQEQVQKIVGNKIHVLNSAQLVAEALKIKLVSLGILADEKTSRLNKFIVSDYTPFFEKQAKLFFGEDIHLKKENIWA